MSESDCCAYKAKIDEYNALFAKLAKKFEEVQLNEPSDDLLDQVPNLKALLANNAKLKYRKEFLQRMINETKEQIKAGTFSKPVVRPQVSPFAGQNDYIFENDSAPPVKKEKKDEKEVEKKQTKAEKKGKEGKKAANKGSANEESAKNEKLEKKEASTSKISYVNVEDYGDSIVSHLKATFAVALAKAYPDMAETEVIITETNNPKFGDYQFNSALKLSKLLKGKTNDAPPVVAKNIIQYIGKGDFIKDLEIAGPGFVNIYLRPEFLGQHIGQILLEGVRPPKITKRRALVDFSSPNIAKEMHVGHLRSTIIGDSVCRLMEFVGFDVLRINHIGDWGTQFGMLIAHLKDRFPNYLEVTPPIGDLQTFYKEAKKRFDEDEEFKARAYQCVVALQSFDADIVKAWKMICEVSRADFSKIYERLDVKITERGESFYQSRMVELVKELDKRGVLTLEEGRKLLFATGYDVPLTIVKSDGGNTYGTSDLTALKHRISEEKVDWAIYVVDAGQGLHLETVYAAGRDLGFYDPAKHRVQHIGFGLVLGEDKKKFKTRSGDTVRLTDLLNTGIERSENKLRENGRVNELTPEEFEAAKEAVAYGCIKYADLSHNRGNDYVFSFDRMLDDKGNTAVYLLYAYARIRSIVRKTNITREELVKTIREQGGVINYSHPAEIKLSKQILKFSDIILSVLDTLLLNTMCDYVYNLSTTYTEFYMNCVVIEKSDGKVNFNRLALCEATADTMAACFKILGLRPIEKI